MQPLSGEYRLASLLRQDALGVDGTAVIPDILRAAGILKTIRLPLDGSWRLGSVEFRCEELAVDSIECFALAEPPRLIHSWGTRLSKLVLSGKRLEWKLRFSPRRS